MSAETPSCDVCGYRGTFADGAAYPIRRATHRGVSLIMEAEIVVCGEHVAWVTDEFPQTLRPLEADSGERGWPGGHTE